MKTDTEFGDQTYWNRPTNGSRRRLPSKYANFKTKSTAKPTDQAAKAKSSSRSPSPTPSLVSSVSTIISPSRSAHHAAHKSKEDEDDGKDEKSIVKIMKCKLPQFSNEADWEISIFKLGLVLDRVWLHADELDIVDYMTSLFHRRSFTGAMETRADRLIYFALTMARKTRSLNSKSWHHVIKMQSLVL
jgi:hypothetical protein